MAAAPCAPRRPEGRRRSRTSCSRDDRTAGRRHVRPVDFLGRAVGSPARVATNFFADTPFSGQVNLLTTGSFDTPQQLFSADSLSRNIAYVALGAPVGEHGRLDGARRAHPGRYLVVDRRRRLHDARAGAASLRRRAVVQHAALRRRQLRWRCATSPTAAATPARVYGFDTFARHAGAHADLRRRATRATTISTSRSLLSPRVELTVTPAEHFRSARAVAPRAGAGRRRIPAAGDSGIWLPPQRTFSSLDAGQPFEAERTDARRSRRRARLRRVDGRRCARSGSTSTISWSRCSASTCPDQPAAKLGHYLVGNAGDVDAHRLRAPGSARSLASRVHGSVEYSLARRAADAGRRPAATWCCWRRRPSRPTPSASTTSRRAIETEVPETATRWSSSTASATASRRPATADVAQTPALDARFDVQVRQSLPFMDFSSAQVGDAARGPQLLPRSGRRSVGLRRAARRPAAQAGRRRRDAAVLDTPRRPPATPSIHNIECDVRIFGFASISAAISA